MIAYITIPEPCHEDWQRMTPNEQGRHCALCCKTVVDFSNWEPQEILFYLSANQADQVCGRFRNNQLNIPIPTPDTFVWQLSQTPLSLLKKIAAIFLFVFGLMTASCNDPVQQAVTPAPGQQVQPVRDNPDIQGGPRILHRDTIVPRIPKMAAQGPIECHSAPIEDPILANPDVYDKTTGGAIVEFVPAIAAPDTSRPVMGKVAAPTGIDTTKK